ncbi:MAG: hypothetical protein HRT68_03115 [Flavobacteriaceae bacterium]|nr:hypothetical protein [Flavobacteriaceae bacterium]
MAKRIIYFSIGLAFGIVFLVFFFKGKGTEFCYLPNCRVLKDIRKKELTVDEKALSEVKLSASELDALLDEAKNDGDINFSMSDTESSPCKTYVITTEKHFVTIKNCKKTAVVEKIIAR